MDRVAATGNYGTERTASNPDVLEVSHPGSVDERPGNVKG